MNQSTSVGQITIYEVIPPGPSDTTITVKSTNLHSYKGRVSDYYYSKFVLVDGPTLRLYYSFATYGIWDQTPSASNIKSYIHKY